MIEHDFTMKSSKGKRKKKSKFQNAGSLGKLQSRKKSKDDMESGSNCLKEIQYYLKDYSGKEARPFDFLVTNLENHSWMIRRRPSPATNLCYAVLEIHRLHYSLLVTSILT